MRCNCDSQVVDSCKCFAPCHRWPHHYLAHIVGLNVGNHQLAALIIVATTAALEIAKLIGNGKIQVFAVNIPICRNEVEHQIEVAVRL